LRKPPLQLSSPRPARTRWIEDQRRPVTVSQRLAVAWLHMGAVRTRLEAAEPWHAPCVLFGKRLLERFFFHIHWKVPTMKTTVSINPRPLGLPATFAAPSFPLGMVVMPETNDDRDARRERRVREALLEHGLAIVTVRLFDREEYHAETHALHAAEDAHLVAGRLLMVIAWARQHPPANDLPVGVACPSRMAVPAALAAREGAPDHDIRALVFTHEGGALPEVPWEEVQVPTRFVCASGSEDKSLLAAVSAHGSREADVVVVQGAGEGDGEPVARALGRGHADWFAHHLSLPGQRGRAAA